MDSRDTCRDSDATGQPVATEIYRSSPYEYALTAESTVKVFVLAPGYISPLPAPDTALEIPESRDSDLVA